MFRMMAKPKNSSIPPRPPSTSPITISSAVSAASSAVVFSVLVMVIVCSFVLQHTMSRGYFRRGSNARKRRLRPGAFAQQVDDGRGNRDEHDQRDDVLQVLACVRDQAAQEIACPGDTDSPQ